MVEDGWSRMVAGVAGDFGGGMALGRVAGRRAGPCILKYIRVQYSIYCNYIV